jgi:hypothetical protein
MIHDTARIAAIRARAAAQLDLITSLESGIIDGEFAALKLARHQTEDIENFILPHLERDHITPAEEVLWLSNAELLLAWTPQLTNLHNRFSKHGNLKIQIIGD